MVDKERRSNGKPPAARLMRDLNEAQRMTLTSLEQFGWDLKFVRHPLFLPPIPIVWDPDHKKYAVLEPDGSLNEKAALNVRP